MLTPITAALVTALHLSWVLLSPGVSGIRAVPEGTGRAGVLKALGPDCDGRGDGGWICTITGGQTAGGGSGDTASGGGGSPACEGDSCTGSAPAKASTADVVEMAMDSIVLPPPRIRTNPAEHTWVGLRTYLWIDRGQWRTRRARISVGGQRVTVSGGPEQVLWNLGEATLSCRGPGVPYSPGGDTYCAYSYQRSSIGQPGGAYTVTATVQYAVRWKCSGACDTRGGSVGPLPATSRTKLSVGEIQTATG